MSGILYLGLGFAVLTSLSIIIFTIFLFFLRNKEILKEIKSELFSDQQQQLDLKLKDPISNDQGKDSDVPALEVDEPFSIGAFDLRTRTGLFTNSGSMASVIMSGSEIISKHAKSTHSVNVLRNINQDALNRNLDVVGVAPYFLFTDTEAFTRPHS